MVWREPRERELIESFVPEEVFKVQGGQKGQAMRRFKEAERRYQGSKKGTPCWRQRC